METILNQFPHRHSFGIDFKEKVDNVQALCEQTLEHLEQSRDECADHFWLDLSRSNYLTMIYLNWDPPKLEAAKTQNEATLRRDPRNFNALWNKWELCCLEENKQAEASKALEEMKRVLPDAVQMCTAKAEIGIYYPDLGPAFYQKAVDLLEETVAEIVEQDFPSAFSSSPISIKWKFDLARTYSRLMNKGTAERFWKGSAPSYEAFFKRIKKLLRSVIKSEDSFYCAKAWIELADAYQKYMYAADESSSAETESLPEGVTVNDCYAKALDKAPEDFFVLERSGRFYRQKGSKEDLERAIGYLEKSIRLNPLRDVAFHHLSQVYRTIWIINEGHDEAKIFQQNPAGGRGGRGRGGKGRGGQGRGGQERERGGHGGGERGRRGHWGGERGRGGRGNIEGFAGPKKPGFFDTLKTNNPISNNPDNRYLQKAITCMEKACELTKGRHPRYLIDHARLLISEDHKDDALQLLRQAENTQLNSTDGAYLYEQLGLLEESMVDNSGGDVLGKAKNCYRRSILHAFEGKEKSRVGIFKLRDILAKQGTAGSVTLGKEHHLIHEAIQNAASSTDILVGLVKDENIARLQELVELFSSEDEEAAAIYAELLKSATDHK